MSIYAISDLHLALNGEKPMDIFGEKWSKHEMKIKENWLNLVSEEDTVLIAGDISWSMNMQESMQELDWIHQLPGKKILIKGNHDYWWGSITALNNLYSDMKFIQNNYFAAEGYAICGTRGWICPGGENFSSKDEKIYKRELIRLNLSIESAIKDGFHEIILMLHYPPINDKFEETELIQIIKKYDIKTVLYGHLHGPSLNKLYQGMKDGIEYIVTSADYLNFVPKLIKKKDN